MSAVVPGYLVTITAFLPADPQAPREMAIAAAMLDSLDEQLEAMGLQERVVAPRFVAKHRLPSPPAAPDPAEPPQPLDHAPAGPAAAGASEEYQAARTGDASPAGPHAEVAEAPATADARALPSPSTAPEVAGSGGHCQHQRTKTYASGVVAGLDCQGIIGGEAA